ncbi:MAG: signal peptide peptidase SppA [Gammaproteobacteria bacterium]|nr:MAG: signal peptide peptidase SppA [Gammaproteobacteria bacterium]
MLGDLFTESLTAITKSRKVKPDDLMALSRDRGALTAPEALEAGYVTAVGYYDEVLEQLRELTGTKKGKPIERQLSVGDYFAATEKKTSGKGKVVVIYAEGMILSGDDEDEVGGDYLARLLRKAREDDKVKAVVLRVNSPGGSASASDVIQRETRLLKQEKPFVVSMGTVAASGGYWISTYADELWAEPNTITGSIGVFGLFLSIQELMNEHGLNVDVVRTSPFADIYSIFRPKTEKELSLVQRIVDRIYEQFLDKVAEGRKLDRQRVHEIAQGRVWSGKEALKLGLVDRLGGLKQAIESAAKRAELGETYTIEEYQRAEELMEVLLKELGMLPEEDDDAQSPDMRLLWQRFQGVLRYTDRQGVYARMPFDLTIH